MAFFKAPKSQKENVYNCSKCYIILNIHCFILELVVRLAHKYGLGEKNVRCLYRPIPSTKFPLFQLILFTGNS